VLPHITRSRSRHLIVGAVAVLAVVVAGCSSTSKKIDNLSARMKGRQATITSYDTFGHRLDRIHGISVDITRDTTFDTTDANGNSNADSSVIMVSIGGGIMTHVGSTLLMVQDGIVDVTDQLPATVDFTNSDRGVPFLNYLRQQFRNAWQGTSRTILVRSQSGYPIAIFGGNRVEYFATNVPKSTLLRIDGRYLLIYRSDYSIYDNSLLQ